MAKAESLMRIHQSILFWLFVTAAIVLLPVLLPLGFVLSAMGKHRKERIAASFLCLTCGKPLGKASLQLADDQFRAYVRRYFDEHPEEFFVV